VRPGGAGYRLTCCLAALAMAEYGLAWRHACGRWLPVWLPVILLATLMSECPGDLTRRETPAVFHDENRGWRPTD
jgi:hypothetical protein